MPSTHLLTHPPTHSPNLPTCFHFLTHSWELLSNEFIDHLNFYPFTVIINHIHQFNPLGFFSFTHPLHGNCSILHSVLHYVLYYVLHCIPVTLHCCFLLLFLFPILQTHSSMQDNHMPNLSAPLVHMNMPTNDTLATPVISLATPSMPPSMSSAFSAGLPSAYPGEYNLDSADPLKIMQMASLSQAYSSQQHPLTR